MPRDSATFRVVFSIESFDGGLNNKYEPALIADIESPDCLNVVFDDLGSVQTRQGYTLLNTTSVGTFAGDGLATTRFNDGSATMVAFWNGTMYTLATTTFTTVPSAQSVFTAGQQIDTAMYQNYMFISDGAQPYKYNGTTFTRHGVNVPNSVPTGYTAISAGSPIGDYHYKVTYVNSVSVQGDVSVATATFAASAAGESIKVNGIPVAPQSFGVNARRLYRTLGNSGVSSTYKLVTEIADNTTTTYTDNKADSALGVAAPTDNGLPPNWNYCKAFQERLWMAENSVDPQLLYYSELGEPFTVGSANFIKIGDGDGEKITGIGIHQNNLVVYKDNSVWFLFMPTTDPTTWVRKKSDAKYGSASHRSIVDYESLQMYLGKDETKAVGFYALSGLNNDPDFVDVAGGITLVRHALMIADSKSERIEPDVFAFPDAHLGKCAAINFKGKLWFAVTHGTSATANNRIYQFDYKRRGKNRASGSWVPFTGIAAADFTVYNGKLYYIDSAATGKVYQLENGTYTDGTSTAIDSYYWTKEFESDVSDRGISKDFRTGFFTVETLGNWNMNIRYRSDADKGAGNAKVFNLSPGGSLWGTMVWGADEWGGGVSRKKLKVDLGGTIGERLQFRFDNQNTAAQAFKVVRGEFFYNRRGYR